MLLVTIGPVLIAAFARFLYGIGVGTFSVDNVQVSGSTIFGLMIWVFYLRFTVPVLGVFYGTALIADEVDDKTITYLFVRPIPRGAVLVGKYLAYLVCTILVVLPSVVLVYLLVVPIGGSLGASFPALVKDLALLSLGLVVYGALFALVGARLKRPLIIGLIFVIGWEPTVLVFPGYLRRFTVAYYLQALVPHSMPQDGVVSLLQAVFRENPSVTTSLLWLAVIWAGCLALAAQAVAKREYVLEQ
jgi:ABC-2 type transport system permease protein